MNNQSIQPLIYIYPHALLFWSVFAWAYWPELKLLLRARRSDKTIDRTSLRVLCIGLALAYALAFSLASRAAWRWPADDALLAFYVGILLLWLGSLLRRHCRAVLDTYFTAHVEAHPQQPVIDTGAYAWLRHPSYSGSILLSTGTGLALGSWFSTAVLCGASIVLFSYRIRIEEHALLEVLGPPYRNFMAKRKRLIPFVY